MQTRRTPIVLLLTLCLLSTPGRANDQDCHGLLFTGDSVAPRERQTICQTAERTKSLLARCGLLQSRPIRIRLVEEPAGLRHPHAVALYDAQRHEITLLDRAHALARLPAGTPYSRLPAEEIHAGLLAHELTHAIIRQQAGSQKLSRTAHEYLAAAMLVTALGHTARKALLQAFPGSEPRDTAALNGFTFQADPQWFTAHAYRHYAAASDRCERIHAVLDGRLRFVD